MRPKQYLGKPQQARELLAPVYGWFTDRRRHRRVEGTHRERQFDGVEPHRSGAQHRRSDNRHALRQAEAHALAGLAFAAHQLTRAI